MISISGIEYQKELESLPHFNKTQAGFLIGKKGRNLDKKIEQLREKGYLLSLKKGLYVSSPFYEKVEKNNYTLNMANILRAPSYISSEYILSNRGLIPESAFSITSITLKSSRIFKNFIGSFIYQNIKEGLFFGYRQTSWDFGTIYEATVAKALFDFLYLKPLKDLKQEIMYDLRINWDNFDRKALQDFESYVKMSLSKKMNRILKIIKKYIYVS